MTNYSTKIKQNLNHIIKEMNRHPQNFVHHPEKDFTRIRKLSFEKMMNFILAMNGNSLYKELMDHFNHDVNTPTTSAFIPPSWSVNPNSPTMRRAILVAFSMSFDAPVEGSWNTISSAVRPPIAYALT